MSELTLDAFLDMPDDGTHPYDPPNPIEPPLTRLPRTSLPDDMPPLVDRPPPMMDVMTYSFDPDFAPLLYNPDSSGIFPPEPAQRFELISEEDAPRITAAKPSHGKKRDAGHIPRPPNAFILFRSSFIKSESVPGNIEGNHSTLSKIIGSTFSPCTCLPLTSPLLSSPLSLSPTGIVWKTLPPAERELWEKRAVQAQAEHRARYPDWRFRPGTNVDAITKRKTKDKNKDRPPARRRRTASARDKALAAAAAADGGGIGDGGGSSARRKARGIIQERRCAQIAELLAQGVKGVALTSAVQAWDKESGVSNVTDGVFVSEHGIGASVNGDVASRGRKEMRGVKDAEAAPAIKTAKTRSASSVQQARFTPPLTSMSRRASSVPLVPDHASIAQGVYPITTAATTNTPPTTSVSPVPDFYPPPLSPASSVSYGSEVSFPDSDNMSVPPMFDFVPFSPPGSPCSSIMDNNDGGVLGSVSPALGFGPCHAPDPTLQLQSFFSSYSTLCDWAGGTSCPPGMGLPVGSNHDNHDPKVVLSPLTLSYGRFGGEADHPLPFLHPTEAIDPWNNVQDLVGRPLFGGLEDSWAGTRLVASLAAPYG
ncbi:hypothetical protein F5148DRAFT_1148221 [Russula earlei]|uniref:Uncharacterized protein n=1 Tax=Russula earlei TaxID=71964 RepID=A0ACC0UCY0_9AGAM|nr:hypothetical protein F5148DRAFT_1148221 [Russula earlei]